MNIKKIRKDFPFFKNNPGLVYLDNAATTQKPKEVINNLKDFYERKNSNIHRGLYKLSEETTENYENSRGGVANFINVKAEEIIFTSGTTNSLNSLSRNIGNIIPPGKTEILISEMEHHSNILPWQRLAENKSLKLKFFKTTKDFKLDLEDLKKKLSKKTAILSFNHISNTLGTINPIKEITSMGKEKGAICIVDAAQSIGHKKIDIKKIGCDFLAFSSHKMLGPLGSGVLYGKKELLGKMNPFDLGGGMVKDVFELNYIPKKIPSKFEGGTPNIVGALGTKVAIEYIKKIGLEEIERQEKKLMKHTLEGLKEIENIKIYNPGIKDSGGIVSFNLKNLHAHDVASLLDDYKIAIRAGHHCTIPLLRSLKINSTARGSFYFYNTLEEVNKFVQALKEINQKYGK